MSESDSSEKKSESPTIVITPQQGGGYSRSLEAPIDAWVRGGTSTSAWDRQIAETEAEAEKRRNQQDADRAICSVPVEQGGGKMFNHHFGHPTDDPKVLVEFVNSKKEVEFKMLCDVGVEHDGSGMWFVFVCPDCVSRGVPSGQAQLRVSDKHRKWFLDQRTLGTPIEWDDGDGNRQFFVSAGQIVDTEVLRCPNAHCTLAVRIHQNRMYRV